MTVSPILIALVLEQVPILMGKTFNSPLVTIPFVWSYRTQKICHAFSLIYFEFPSYLVADIRSNDNQGEEKPKEVWRWKGAT